MGIIKQEFNKLKDSDIWSLMLFALFKVREVPEYSGISELAYVLDKENMLRLCEFFGGTTITIPTIDELELLTYGLLLYQYIHLDNIKYEEAIKRIENPNVDIREVKLVYVKIKEVLSEYDISSRGKI